MELRIYDRPTARPAERRWRLPRPRWLGEFEHWAAPEVEPEREEERSFAPVALLLGLALLVQYAQYFLPPVRAFLEERDIAYRTAWVVFSLFKQWGLFVLMVVAVHVKEDSLASLGFPRLDARRVTLALGLVGFSLGAALLRGPSFPSEEAALHWLVPFWPGERALVVVQALTAAIVEETLFRGFAVVWTYRWSGHLLLSVLFPALVFAAGHGYLGWLNVGVALLAAVGFSLLFFWRRDLYWPMVLHFLLDALILLA